MKTSIDLPSLVEAYSRGEPKLAARLEREIAYALFHVYGFPKQEIKGVAGLGNRFLRMVESIQEYRRSGLGSDSDEMRKEYQAYLHRVAKSRAYANDDRGGEEEPLPIDEGLGVLLDEGLL